MRWPAAVHTISQANLTGDFRSETPKRAFFGWQMPTKSQGKRRSGWEDANEKLGRESAKQFEDKNPGALANVFQNKKVQTAANKAVVFMG
jgi:hypothetical protein